MNTYCSRRARTYTSELNALFGRDSEIYTRGTPRPYESAERLYIGEGRGAGYEGINDDPWLGDERSNKIFRRRIKQTQSLASCKYCNSPLLRVSNTNIEYPFYTYRTGPHGLGFETFPEGNAFLLSWCENCRHWMLASHSKSSTERNTWEMSHSHAFARGFHSELPAECTSELAQYYRRKPERFAQIDPRKLEVLVCDIFRANFKNAEVIHVGRPGDGGTDVLFVDSRRRQWLIQVKRNNQGKEPFSTIQQLAGTLLIENKLRGIVVTSALGFSRPAVKAVDVLCRRGMTINLIDRGILNRMLSPLLPRHPWKPYFKLCGLPADVWQIAREKIRNAQRQLTGSNC